MIFEVVGTSVAVKLASKKASELPASEAFKSCTEIALVPATRYEDGLGDGKGTKAWFSIAEECGE